MNAVIPNSSYKHQAPHAAGFTLIELMVTIAVLAIIVSIAAPSFNEQLAQNQIKITATSIQTSISKAKAESSITRNDITWTYDRANNRITLTNGSNPITSYDLSSKSSLTFTPATATTLIIRREGAISTTLGTTANVAIDISDTRSTSVTKRVRINTKRAFECSGTNC